MQLTSTQLRPLVQRASALTLATSLISSAVLFASGTYAADAAAPATVPSFASLDLNQDQFIDAKEAQALPALAKVFTAADTDKDGRLSPDEYAAVASKLGG